MTRGKSRVGVALAATLAVLLGAGCGGGGGGGGGGGPTLPQPGITFTEAAASPPAIRLARGPVSTATLLELEVRADQLPEIYGVAFDLTYPSELLRFDAAAEGTFLGAGGVGTSVQVVQSEPGRLVVGATRLGEVAGTGGSGVLLTLRFTAVAPGGGPFRFLQNRAFDSAGEEVPGVAWAGGSVQVIR